MPGPKPLFDPFFLVRRFRLSTVDCQPTSSSFLRYFIASLLHRLRTPLLLRREITTPLSPPSISSLTISLMYNLPQRLTAEFIGTFALVFFGAGAICADQFLHGAAGPNLLLIAVVQGLTFAVMYSALAHVSGAHFNPAITIGFWVTKRSSTVEVALYWIAQPAAATLAPPPLKTDPPPTARGS